MPSAHGVPMRLSRLPVLALVPLVLLAGCLEPSSQGGEGGDGTPGGGNAGGDVDFQTIERGRHTGVEGGTRQVIDTQDDWSAFWDEHTSRQMPAPARPGVDFSEQRVVAAVLEDKGNGCWSVAVTNVTQAAGGIQVEVTTYEPTPDHACPSVIVRPYHFVAIPAGPEPITFLERTETAPADGSAGGGGGEPAAGGSASCLEGAEECPDTDGRSVEDVETRDLDHGTHSGVAGPARRVILDADEWAAFWDEHASRQIPPPERPAVDFEQGERVVAVVLEDKPNGCWAVRVTNVTTEGEGALVEVTTYAPPPDAFCTDVVANPFHFVAIAAPPGDVRFTERESTQEASGNGR